MGRYLNPPDMSKEMWLIKNAIPFTGPPKSHDELEGHTAACLVDNGAFTACALAFNNREVEVFSNSRDSRPKDWFWIPNHLTHMFK